MAETLRVSVRDVLRQFSQLGDRCLSSPVIITKNGRDRLVLMSIDEYHSMRSAINDRRPPAETAADAVEHCGIVP